ncbi:hypothetical protein ACFL1N_07375 [Thermodesulfobacteriota bacterium]
MRRFFVIAVILLIAMGGFAQSSAKTACDRACLEGYVDKYLDAMMNNNPSLDLFTRDCKFTENGIRLPLGGEGLWYSMSGRGKYKFYVPDVETRQVAFIGTVKEGGGSASGAKPGRATLPAIALRLKIDDNGKISEAEQLVIRPEQSLSGGGGGSPGGFPPTGESVEKLGAPHKIFMETIPESERMQREELVVAANYYFEGLQRNDHGKGYYPFTDDCHRIENGMPSTNVPLREGQEMPDPKTATMYSANWGCKEQFESGTMGFITRVRDRRFVAVDRERGIVFAFGFFDHHSINFTWQLAELFKVENGLIRRIEAVFHKAPFGINSGWSSYEQGMSEEIQSIR